MTQVRFLSPPLQPREVIRPDEEPVLISSDARAAAIGLAQDASGAYHGANRECRVSGCIAIDDQIQKTRVILMNSKTKDIADRIRRLEEAIAKGREYLESGAHAHWHGFRPWFAAKQRDGKNLPPHKDWVKNVFLPQLERALQDAEKLLDKLSKRGRGYVDKE